MRHAFAFLAPFLVVLLLVAGCGDAGSPPEARWWRGNLHTHSLWSDGDDYPEMILQWYRDNGYDFVALSDHNVIADHERWIDVDRSRGGRAAFDRYLAAFGEPWVEHRMANDTLRARLKTYDEFSGRYNEPNAFLVIKSEEITDGFDGRPVHMNATNIQAFIPPQRGGSMREVMQNNVDAVLRQREETGVPMFPHINHPNFGWAMTAEDLFSLEGERFFEVYNGHPAVHNEGDALRPGTERMWDIILTRRLLAGDPVMYGLAVDDSHNYHAFGLEQSNTGRAWVMVRADTLSAEALIAAMEAGDFYGTTGVVLDDVRVADGRLSLAIRPEEGVSYTTYFIGTPAAHDTTSTPMQQADGRYVTRSYSEEVGDTLGIASSLTPEYPIQGTELYVRAKVVSTKPKENPYRAGETEMAWTQPVTVPHP